MPELERTIEMVELLIAKKVRSPALPASPSAALTRELLSRSRARSSTRLLSLPTRFSRRDGLTRLTKSTSGSECVVPFHTEHFRRGTLVD